nr:hypothetical protein [Streptomyces barkulensis]
MRRSALLGSVHDALTARLREATGRARFAETGLTPGGQRTVNLLAAARSWLVDLARAGWRGIDHDVVSASAQVVSAMLPDPSLRRPAALLDGFAAELAASCPGATLERVPVRRWADLWSRAMLLTLPGAADAPAAGTVTGRLLPLGVDAHEHATAVQWILRRLMPHGAARPIMGERKLGERPIQESWDLALGTHQRSLIELGYEGVSVEQVLEQRLRRTAYDSRATAATVLGAVEDTVLYLRGHRLAGELGTHALKVLSAERSVDGAPEVLRRVRRLLAYYRTGEPVLPPWIESFVKAGYAHYCTLLPTAFTDDDAGVRQVAAMLGFLFGMESLALSLGCDRTQLELALAQSRPRDPAKTALLWAARTHLGQLTR